MPVGIAELKNELTELRESYPNLPDTELFVLWFVRAFLVDSDDDSRRTLTGGSHDKGIDAVYVDEGGRKVYLVQGKYRLAGGGESRNDVMSFAALGRLLNGDASTFSDYCDGLDELVKEKVKTARDRLTKRDYELRLLYVTLGRVSVSLQKEAKRLAARAGDELAIFDRQRVFQLLDDYLDGVAPPPPLVELPIEAGSGPISRLDRRTGIESWVLSVPGSALARLYDEAGIRLFARNIRGFLGMKTPVNQAILDTLSTNPDHFWYFNNGVTMVCSGAEQSGGPGSFVLEVQRPQIINGQQTTRTLAESPRTSSASVLLRVIVLPPEKMDLVGEIVRATNDQNRISLSDLMSNDRRQIVLERSLRKRGYNYLRKRQTKQEARRTFGGSFPRNVTKEQLAQAVAACEFPDPWQVRSAKEHLFSSSNYDKIFKTDDVVFYLMRYWLLRAVEQVAREEPGKTAGYSKAEAGYAKFLVVRLLWELLSPLSRKQQIMFITAREEPRRFDTLDSEVLRSARLMLHAVMSFYRESRGRGSEAQSVYVFFKRQRQNVAFNRYWKTAAKARREHLSRAVAQLKADLDATWS